MKRFKFKPLFLFLKIMILKKKIKIFNKIVCLLKIFTIFEV